MNTTIPYRPSWLSLAAILDGMIQRIRPGSLLVALFLAGMGNPAFALTTTQIDLGAATDFFVPADFDGDGKTDLAVWRPGAAGVAAFIIRRSSDQIIQTNIFGQTGDNPTVVGDYDGDGKADLALYRPGASSGLSSTWIYRSSSSGTSNSMTWGQNGDFPAPGDYDGDHKYDFVVGRGVAGTNNYLLRLSSGVMETNAFGAPSDSMVPGDYDGDGKTDFASVRGVGGKIEWHIKTRTGALQNYTFGNSATDFMVQGDYNGDGKTDVAVWRPPGTFYVHYSPAQTTNIDLQIPFGQNGDYPVANFNTH